MRIVIRLFVAIVLVATSCGGGGLDVKGAWARASVNVQNAGAIYLTITGGDDADRLVGASVPTGVAAVAELHETSMAGDGSGMMSMQQVTGIDVAAGAEVLLEPGGFHVMLMNLAEPLQLGDEFELTLTFENGGTMVIPVEVREN